MRLRLFGPVTALLVTGVTAIAVTGCGGGSKHSSTSAAAVRGPLPGGVVGVTFNGPAVDGQVNVGQQLDLAVASGVESLRVSFNWAATQPYRSFSQVPAAQRSRFVDVNGVPTRFAPLDEIVGAAAARGLTVLPVVERTALWDAPPGGNTGSTPISAAPYAAFLTALVKRYGPNGTFWAAHPSIRAMPIRMWQIWNEPHFTNYWSRQPFAPSYVRLLRAAHDAIRAADPSAKVVLAGLADISWQYLAQIYMVPGARSLFDVVAIHPYTAKAAGVIIILKKVRAVMARFGDANKPILATEITWPSSQGKAPPQFGVSTTEAQQAQRLDQVMPMLADDRTQLGLMGFYWYTWMGDEGPATSPYAFNFAGLLKYVRGTVSPKPALGVFKRRALEIEGCRRKASNAETCA